MNGARWTDEGRFELGGTKFIAAGLLGVSPREDCFVVDKPPELVRKYFRLLEMNAHGESSNWAWSEVVLLH